MRFARSSTLTVLLLVFFVTALPAAAAHGPRAAAVARQGEALATVALTRGPYLNRATPAGVVIRWRTDLPAASRVLYGDAPDMLLAEVEDPALKTEHEVALADLAPDSLYFYAVADGGGVLAGGDAGHFFRTAPMPGVERPIRIWAIGDSGTADADAAAVRDAYLDLAAGAATDVWLMLGDNAYNTGTDAEYQAAVFDTYPTLLRNTVLWPTIGNHDAASSDSLGQSGPYFEIFTLPAAAEAGGLPTGTEAYYSFDYGNVHFVCLDSSGSDRTLDGAMMQWLEADVNASAQTWIVAYWHHPPYTKGSHDSDNPVDSGSRMFDMRERALPILEAAGVDLVLAGHSHAYERSFLVDGHYGTSDTLTADMVLDGGSGDAGNGGAYFKLDRGHQGTVYAVAGSSGRVGGGTLDHPVTFVASASLGSLVIDVDGTRLDARFLTGSGEILDRFTLIKDPPSGGARVFSDGFESGDVTAWSSGGG